MPTTLQNKTIILADLWLNYRDEEEFQDFIEYNDLGLPLAYAIANGIVGNDELIANKFVEETFDLFLKGLDLEDDEEGFETLDEILGLEF